MNSVGCLAILALAAFGATLYLREGPHPLPGLAVGEEPEQTPTANVLFTLGLNVVKPLARYRVHARVLAAKTYRFDRESSIAPRDLALGWGRMSDWSVYSALGIGQSGRFYHYQWGAEGPPLPREEIVTHSANTHVIPADAAVRSTLGAIRAGDVIRLDGDLVEVQGRQGEIWRSSLSRADSGTGACELVYARSLAVEAR